MYELLSLLTPGTATASAADSLSASGSLASINLAPAARAASVIKTRQKVSRVQGKGCGLGGQDILYSQMMPMHMA